MNKPMLVAAIYIGTDYSGHAFSSRQDYLQDPLKMWNRNWFSENRATTKIPSTLLLTPHKKFHSFGYEAEEKFVALAETGYHKDWFYFRHFKMILYENKSLNLNTMMKDENGREMPAFTVFLMAIRYMRDDLIEHLNPSGRISNDEDKIRWVLTVPAIVDERTKQFMHEVAQEAGIKPETLLLALEPEAASIYCYTLSRREKGSMIPFNPGMAYLVLDLGETTTDFTAYEIKRNGTRREIYKSTSGTTGLRRVDDAFNQFLIKLFGNDVLTDFKRKYTWRYNVLLQDFEIKKTTVNPDLAEQIALHLPAELINLIFEHTGNTLEEILPQTAFAETIKLKNCSLRMNSMIFKNFFSDLIKDITNYTCQFLKECNIPIRMILLVGDLSQYPTVSNALREEFRDNEIYSYYDSNLAVLKGAVLFGHDPNEVF